MLLLAFAIQSGASPQDRFELEKTLAEAVLGKEATVGGEPATLEDISTLPEFSEWLQNGGLDLSDFQFGGRAWVRTYNELVGDVRLEVIRADKYTCPWKVDGYQRMYRLTRPYVLEDGSYSASGEYPGCYSFLTPNTMENVRAARTDARTRTDTHARTPPTPTAHPRLRRRAMAPGTTRSATRPSNRSSQASSGTLWT